MEIELLELENHERMKSKDQIQEEKNLTEEKLQEKESQAKKLKDFMEKPMVILQISPYEKEQITLRPRLTIQIGSCFLVILR